MRSWTPRGPSPNLKARLFGSTATDSETSSATHSPEGRAFSWQWLAPSTVLVLLSAFLLGHQGAMLGLNSTSSPAVLASPETDLSAYYVPERHSGNNNIPVVGLEWTNGSVALSGVSRSTPGAHH
jgi:hypothetical protein